ncbi:hypothetical protein OH460_08670 [Vibrio sp. Makdt]|uniref:hypothetical protein n=1 Tax=Vibrio sp. Makdt TaxID=2998828 RepID=UPI0022CD9CD7|nr:hypothetical protein [Vibrio sp. Makdt]MDA0152374.1 hypothetical protein [Vibrio sp. Makdt]
MSAKLFKPMFLLAIFMFMAFISAVAILVSDSFAIEMGAITSLFIGGFSSHGQLEEIFHIIDTQTKCDEEGFHAVS